METKTPKLIVTKKFINRKVPSASKMFIQEALQRSREGKITVEEYNELCLVYVPDLPANANLLSGELKLIFKIDNIANTVILDEGKLRYDWGIWIQKRKFNVAPVDPFKAHDLLCSYNEVRSILYRKKKDNKNIQLNNITLTPARSYDCLNLIRFFENSQINDWFLYLYTIHASTNWVGVWSLKQAGSAKALDLYVSNKDRCLLEINERNKAIIEATNKEEAQKSGTARTHWVHMYPHIEDQKKRLLNRGQQEVCHARFMDLLGYHPMSETCTKCPLKAQCAETVQKYFKDTSKSDVDILKVRVGMIGIPEAQQQIKAQGSSFEFYI